MEGLCSISKDDWRTESAHIGEFFSKLGDRLPPEMAKQNEALAKRLK
jgi:GTP-dependent phosphoenolpyruvate carboxykinase